MGENTIGGGWLQTLDVYMQEKVELHVAFYASWQEKTFKCRKSTYHVIPSDSIKVSNVKNILYPHVTHFEDTPKYLEIIERVKPDLIHLHGTENAYGTFLSKINIPVVCSLQGILTPYVYRMAGDAAEDLHTHVGKSGGGLKAMIFEKGHRHQYHILQLMAARESKYIGLIRNFIGRTQWDKRVSSVLSPGSNYFVGDEIMRDAFYNAIWKPLDHKGRYVIHTTASDHPMKGFRTVADAVLLLRSAGIDIEWRIAGLSDNSAVVRIAKKQLGKKYPSDSIQLLGRIGATELVAKMLEADVFVLPSYMENSPNSLCEAMMMGMPCVATNGGGTPSMLADNEEGFLVQPRDPWALAGALIEMMNDQARAVEMGRQARKRALHRHDPSRIVEQVYSVYKNILGR